MSGYQNLTTFLAVSKLALMLVVGLLGPVLCSTLVNKFSPSSILALIPIQLLIFSLLGPLTHSHYLGVAINLVFLFIHKSTYSQVLKICLQTIHSAFKTKVFLFINFSISIALLLISWLMDLTKSYFQMDAIYVALIILSVVIILVVLRFDTQYLRNKWKNLSLKSESLFVDIGQVLTESEIISPSEDPQKLFNPHNFFIEKYKKELSSEISDFVTELKIFGCQNLEKRFTDIFYSEKRTPHECFLLILNIYVYAANEGLIKEATLAHKSMLQSKRTDQYLEKAYQLFFLVDTKEFRHLLDQGQSASSQNVSLYCKKSILLLEHLDFLCPFEGRDRPQRRLIIFTQLNWSHLAMHLQEKLICLINKQTSKDSSLLALWLSDADIFHSKIFLLEYFNEEKMQFSWVDITFKYLDSRKDLKKELQNLFIQIRLPKFQRKIINKILINKIKVSLNKIHSFDAILDLLFLVEWVSLKNAQQVFVLESIRAVTDMSLEEKEHWVDFHFDFLKKTKFFFLAKTLSQQMQNHTADL